MSPRLTAATARRVLAQLRHDPRTLAILLLLPCLLLFDQHFQLGDLSLQPFDCI